MYGAFFAVIALFLWSRLYRLSESLEFYSDIGRDHYVLLQTLETKKPPLLGPTNSALPLTQSPWYYYGNLPIFVLSNQSPFTTIYTLTAMFLCVFLLLYLLFYKNPSLLLVTSCVVVLVTTHPQILEQHRYAWNPTYALPFLIVALLALFHSEFVQKARWIWIWIFSTLAAVGCSYSVFPVALVLLVYGTYRYKGRCLSFITPAVVSFLIIFGPLLLFEFRHGFQFLQGMKHFQPQQTTNMRMEQKIIDLVSYVLGTGKNDYFYFLAVAGILVCSLLISVRKANRSYRENIHIHSFLLLICSVIVTVCSPFPLLTHYIFGILALFLLITVTAHPTALLLLLGIFLWKWIPFFSYQLFNRVPRRTVAQLSACAQVICKAEKDPMYVSVQAWHPYHFAPDHLFFLRKAGCNVKDITQSPGYATTMAVVADQSPYEIGKTTYNELTLFGKSTVKRTYTCSGGMQVVLLTK